MRDGAAQGYFSQQEAGEPAALASIIPPGLELAGATATSQPFASGPGRNQPVWDGRRRCSLVLRKMTTCDLLDLFLPA